MVLGGQGAPFAPLYHHALFAAGEEPVAVVNIGGIANISYFIEDKAFGYDLGPGNCLLDAWIFKQRSQSFDASGAWAASGTVNEPLLRRLLQDPYFSLNPPKSIGKEYFSLAWLDKYLWEDVLAEDVQASLVALTAKSIADGILVCPTRPSSLILCGGGVHNQHLKQVLASYLPGVSIVSSAEQGVDPDYLEAMMFAWLADKALRGEPLDLRQITGAKKTAVLGVIYAAGIGEHQGNRN
jgi:anhydro-N-acetylmuramic acid kinase